MIPDGPTGRHRDVGSSIIRDSTSRWLARTAGRSTLQLLRRSAPDNSRVRKHPVQIGLLNQRRDGFVSLDALRAIGTVTTKSFRRPPGRMHLNVDADGGEVRVTVLDGSQRLLSQSVPIMGNRLSVAVEVDDLSKAGELLSVRFQLTNAKLFSYWFDA